ncbi:MAG: hypothetical protein QM604_04255 [Microbacterium sp.]
MRYTTLTLESVAGSDTSAVEFTFQPARPIRFRPGQAGVLILRGGGAKPFTLSGDANSPRVSIATSLRSGSRFKTALAHLQPGERAHLIAPIGAAVTLAEGRHEVLVAQGIGITPFLAAARTYRAMDATLLQVGGAHLFDQTAASVRDARHVDHRDGLAEVVDETLRAHVGDHWSVSGRSDFVAGITAHLTASGVPRRQIRTHAFWTMPRPRPVAAAAPTRDEAARSTKAPSVVM